MSRIVQVTQDILQHFRGSGGIQGNTRLGPGFSNLLDGSVKVMQRLRMDGDDIRACIHKVLDEKIRAGDHQVDIERKLGDRNGFPIRGRSIGAKCPSITSIWM
jgi:hypothetical protein